MIDKLIRMAAVSFSIVSLLFATQQASTFHLSFGARLLRSITNPQLNPASTLIRPIECRNANNQSEAGICMFSIDCMQNKGVPLSVCKHNYFVGTCCRLPDYNNFVGIVYDLRDTETNQVLEARNVQPSTSGELAPSAPVTSAYSAPTSLKPPESSPGTKLDERYMISSTSLFPTSTSAQPTTVSPHDSHRPTRPTGGSITKADGGPIVVVESESKPAQHLVVAAGELDSFQIQTSLSNRSLSSTVVDQPTAEAPAGGKPTGQLSAYEIVKDESLEVLSSAHSAPAGQGVQLNRSNDQSNDASPRKSQQNTSRADEIYLVDDPRSLVSDGPHQTGGGIVFANNHQPSAPDASNSTRSETSGPTVQSDQEFTLSSALATASSQSYSTGPSEVSSSVPTTTAAATTTEVASTSSSTASPASTRNQEQPVTSSSPFVDLVSSSHSTQTTTPFTTSLSTAILPNVTSHAWSPTTISPPVEVTTTSPMLVSNAVLFASTPKYSSPRPSTSEQPAMVGFIQLYSNQHSSQTIGHHDEHQALRPSLQVASKIVGAASGQGGSSNNLIPGLSGLQSAILSHIPFKLASGLSSGLSSYLQAAMKPTGNRPLLSSNTAPASQYQQSLSNSSKIPAQAAVRFPGATNGTIGPFVGSNAIDSGSTLSLTTWTQQSITSSTLAPVLARDVVKEARLVCGRAQVSSSSGETTRKRVARIVGGNQSSFGQWPWMVSLRQWRKGAFLHKCGAALLNENWAITAAHCVENVKAPDLLLRLGEFDVSNQEEPYPYIERRVKQVVSHPSFDPKTFEYDLALLRFTEPIKFERNILPVCVPNGNDSYVDRMATVIGWGRLYEDGPLPDVIQHVDVPIITNNECEKMYKNAGYIEEIPDMFICAGISKGGRDSCEGDSGGPLTMLDHDGRSYLVGIISWGIGCALPSQPGVYTRITAFSGWINQITAF